MQVRSQRAEGLSVKSKRVRIFPCPATWQVAGPAVWASLDSTKNNQTSKYPTQSSSSDATVTSHMERHQLRLIQPRYVKTSRNKASLKLVVVANHQLEDPKQPFYRVPLSAYSATVPTVAYPSISFPLAYVIVCTDALESSGNPTMRPKKTTVVCGLQWSQPNLTFKMY